MMKSLKSNLTKLKKSLNEIIPKNPEERFFSALKKDLALEIEPLVALSIFCFFSIVSLIQGIFVLKQDTSILFKTLSSISLFFAVIFICIFTCFFTWYCLKYLWLLGHMILPGKEQRRVDVCTEIEYQLNYVGFLRLPRKDEDLKKTFIKDMHSLNADNLKHYLHKWFNKTSSSWIRFYGERINASPGGRHFGLDRSFVLFSLSIPRRKELSLDTLKTILISYSSSGGGAGFYDTHNRSRYDFTEGSPLDPFFVNYKEEDIKNLFTHNWNPFYFEQIVLNSQSLQPQSFPVFKRMADLYRHIQNTNSIRYIYHQVLKDLPMVKDGLKYTVALDQATIVQLGEKYQNCLRHSNYSNSDVIEVLPEDGSPGAVVAIEEFSIREIRSVRNQRSNLEPLIKKHLLELFEKDSKE